VRRRADREVHLALEEGRLRGRATPAGVNWEREVPDAFRFAAQALDEALRAQARESLGFELALSPSERSEKGWKLGLGGSARAAVLASEAARFVLEERADALKVALLAHVGAQGSGSGADVAACFAGGLIRYRRYETRGLADASREGRLGAALTLAAPVEVARLPEPKLSLLYAFTGQAASTPLLVKEIEARVRGEKRARFAAHSEEWGRLLEEGLLSGDLAAVTEACGELQLLLSSLGPVETEPMKRILALARSYQSTGKLSGAGGGDGCVLFCPDVETRTGLGEALGARGFAVRPLELEPGLRGERAADPRLRAWLDAS
jgi:phosphomevalonate kinase